jgi:hypothetical protein
MTRLPPDPADYPEAPGQVIGRYNEHIGAVYSDSVSILRQVGLLS